MSLDKLASDLRRIVFRGGSIHVRKANTALPVAFDVTGIVDDGAGTATVTTAAAHGLTTAESVIVFGAYESRFNGTFSITVTGGTTFTYTVTGTAAASATGRLAAVETSVALPADERFVNLGIIREPKFSFEPSQSSKSTTGAIRQFGTDFTLEFTLQQTSDIEFAALEELTQEHLDFAVFSSAVAAGHSDKGLLVAALEDGFLLYNVLAQTGGEVNLSGSESGIKVTVNFFGGIDVSGYAIGA